MKRTVTKAVVLSLAMIMMLASAAMAGVITINRLDGYYDPNTSGGEFNITIVSGLDPDILNLYASVAKVGQSFESFCLEKGEHVYMGDTYNAEVNYVGAVAGGLGGDKVTINGVTTDPISLGTAYLYSEFASGTLSAYNYTVGASRASSAAELQQAIWYLEGELGTYAGGNQYVESVITLFGSLAAAMADNNGHYAVGALNLTDLSGERAQDQLILTPEPSSLLLFGIALLGAAGLRRKFKND